MVQLDNMHCQQAWQALCNAQNVLLLTHKNPDADGISACAAFDIVLRRLNKNVQAVYPTPSEQVLERQPADVCINKHSLEPDIIVICDTANRERAYWHDSFMNKPVINLDHHISNSINATYNFVVGDASSACEVVYAFLATVAPDMIDQSVAECLLFGILYDTQIFQIASTTADTLRTAAALVDKGCIVSDLVVELNAHKDPRVIAFWGALLQSVQYNKNKTAVWVVITQALLAQYGMTQVALVGLNNFLATLSCIDVIAVFTELVDGNCKVSLRSKQADVNKLAQHFGGGGHVHAAGISMQQSIDTTVACVTVFLQDL